MKKILTLFLWLFGASLFSQVAPDVYLVSFTDKDNNPYSINQPQEFLSDKALSRRARYNIKLTEQDLPVNPSYIQAVNELAPVKNISKWFNSVNVTTTDPAVLDAIESLPFVRDIKSAREVQSTSELFDKMNIKSFKTDGLGISLPDTSFYNYGDAGGQIAMLNGHILHNLGFQGQGMIIAVLDAGFSKVDINPAFDSLRLNNQILGGWDFVKDSPLTYNKHAHGAQVLSIMAANLPGIFVGTAPKAMYYLLRTEDGSSEYLLEEENWIRGAEFADSAGVDLINSSLSYTDFNDPEMSHTYEDMDGNSTRITRAADIAASKGILVVTSAANEGETEWKYIGAPADGDSVLTVGAVDADKVYAPFSSIGPTYDGRIKPNVTAQGRGTYFAGTNGEIYSGSGTSFSSPIICGLAACLWQSKRTINNYELLLLIQEISSQANEPDNLLGYGLPDFSKGFFVIQGIDFDSLEKNSFVRIFPNPFYNSFTLDYYSTKAEPYSLELWDLNGRMVLKEEHDPGFGNYHRLNISGLDGLSTGVFIVRLISSGAIIQTRVMKQKATH